MLDDDTLNDGGNRSDSPSGVADDLASAIDLATKVLPEKVPLLPLHHRPIFPGMVLPFQSNDPLFGHTLRAAMDSGKMMGFVLVRNPGMSAAEGLSLDDVLSQIHQRTAIYRQNMLELEWAKCYAFNELAHQGWPATAEQYATYNRRIQDLHADQRAERIAFWKDVSDLRRALPESVQQFLSTYRKLEILDDNRGDAQ